MPLVVLGYLAGSGYDDPYIIPKIDLKFYLALGCVMLLLVSMM